MARWGTLLLVLVLASCSPRARETTSEHYDLVIRNGVVYDGTGSAPQHVDVAVRGDRIAALLAAGRRSRTRDMDATGLAVAPGFINMLSWATESLIADGRSQGDIRQGVTLEVIGEGWSMGPLNDGDEDARRVEQAGRHQVRRSPGRRSANISTISAQRGISPNVASFVGATTVRIHELGYDDRAADRRRARAHAGARARRRWRRARSASARRSSTRRRFYAKTDELVALCEGGGANTAACTSRTCAAKATACSRRSTRLIAHRARARRCRAEIYHLKAAGEANWPKLDAGDREGRGGARRRPARSRADMYTYTAGATGLDAAMPPWVQEGGSTRWVEAAAGSGDPRARAARDDARRPTSGRTSTPAAGSPERVLLVGFKSDALKPLTGKTLAEVAQDARQVARGDRDGSGGRGRQPRGRRLLPDVRGQRRDAGRAAVGELRLGRRVDRRPKACSSSRTRIRAPTATSRACSASTCATRRSMPLEEAVRRLTALPATNLEARRARPPRARLLRRRRRLRSGDDRRTTPRSTKPHQYATGVRTSSSTACRCCEDGEHTGAKPGRVVRGPGWVSADAGK